MLGGGLCPRILAVSLGLIGVCAGGACDPPLCPSEVSVAFQQTAITSDLDPAAAGVQTDIHIRTSLQEGELLSLEVLSGDGTPHGTLSTAVAADGSAVFTAVSVPEPRVVLRATARGSCGIGRDEIAVDVLAGTECAVQLVPEPESSAYFAPRGVLSTRSDPDPVTPGYQTMVRVVTRPGWSTEIFEITTVERSLGVIAAAGDGIASAPVTVLDGAVAFRATCRGAGGERASRTAALVADTTPPWCELLSPTPGATITPSFDANHDLSDGVQLAIAARSDAADVVGEPVSVTIGERGGSVITVAGTDVDETGASAALATLAPATTPATFDVTLAMRDHAGNSCMSVGSYDVVYLPPPAIADLAGVAPDRQRVELTWTAPADGGQAVAGYLLKSSPAPFSEATFDTAGTALPIAAPGAPGSAEAAEVFPARTGLVQYFAIAALDAAGNRSAAAFVGPIVPVFDQTGAIRPINANQGALGFGSAIVHGRFNDDDFDDLAIAAPTQNLGGQARVGAVHVYFGGPPGITATPGLVITSAETGANLGAGLAAVRWSSATRDDLAIGAPGASGGAGRLFVLRGGGGFGSGTRAATTAELHVTVSTTQPGWFASGGLGAVLAAADVDGDGTDDLIAAAPRGGDTGGAAILYGGTVTGNVVLSSQDASGANGAIVELFADPGAVADRRLGFYLHAVGPTLGALDATDDFVIAYADDYATAGDSLYVVRGDGTRPAAAGVTQRPFVPGRDVRLDFATPSKVTEWASQVTSIEDQNGDGARDLVIGAYRAQNGHGQVVIVSGSVVGSVAGVARTSDPGVTLTTIVTTTAVNRFGAAIATHDRASRPDIDGDGQEDLLIGGLSGTTGTGFVWFGGAIGSATITTASAQYLVTAPSTIKFQRQSPQGFGGQARWLGDINGDGLDDLCWASPFDSAGDGSFEVLWDAR